MGWEQRVFKGKQTVFAEVNDSGELVVVNGRVAIKYNDSEGAKVYHANVSNLKAGSKKTKKSGGKQTKEDIANYDENIWESPRGSLQITRVAIEETEFEPPKGEVWAYTDGACSGNPGPCASGVVVVTEDELIDASQFIGLGTNNVAELYAFKIAIDLVPDDSTLRIFSDSQYAIDMVTKNWKAKANKKLITELRSAKKNRGGKTEFVKVKGHSGDPLNERADRLAVEANQTK